MGLYYIVHLLRIYVLGTKRRYFEFEVFQIDGEITLLLVSKFDLINFSDAGRLLVICLSFKGKKRYMNV